ncbi:MAG: RHS repeat-associated core domain-containing protein [Acidobacteriales bacterium]|nr:RHS repeat-associated core domain-containing protein [Terriglobales bacterium]
MQSEFTYDSTPRFVHFSYRFTGKERDTESGLDYFGARYYGSSMGRFMSPDPGWLQQADPMNPQTWNQYSYGLNNPLINTDPTGKTCQTTLAITRSTTTMTVKGVQRSIRRIGSPLPAPQFMRTDAMIWRLNHRTLRPINMSRAGCKLRHRNIQLRFRRKANNS